jgi:crossover junction endodeoxyribonuclease RuvC
VATLVEAGVVRLNAKLSIADRLAELDTDLRELLERLQPSVVAVEKLYAHYKHPTTAIVMGHARGVVLLNIRRAGLTLVELGATEVKKSLTGNGHAGKLQMQDGVRVQLGLAARPEPADVADAAAIALCAMRRR